MKQILVPMLLAGCGGFVGTCCRFLVGRLCAPVCHGAFPLATLLVNLVGCFIIGLLFGLIEKGHVLLPFQNVLLITGFCGGFTTFSAFADDMLALTARGEWLTFGLYGGLSVVAGIALVWLGRWIAA